MNTGIKLELGRQTYKSVPEIKINSCDGCVFLLYRSCSVRNAFVGINTICQKNKTVFAIDDEAELVHENLVERLKKRAEICRNAPIEGQPDRISDLLEEAATEIERIRDTKTQRGNQNV